ncbi:MAG TPA: pseudoazurin [Ferrovibrio sp.]|uniref:pseudoazurin n=1 Tax=Ferrovibrio sp. TaxID=1917215 RepID=UPI002B4B0BF1|nr:pseudoazurin [Ferrovibrio sp.]HLT78705.1 pseudoazurin [Ferrovibrio sp.]
MRTGLVLGLALASLALVGPVSAAEFEVKMLDKGQKGVMVFEPALVKAAPGDKVTFVPTNKGHNVETIDGMLPAGVAPVVGKYNETISITFDKPGVYGFKCKPHYGMGMVAMVVVGSPENENEARAVSHPGKAKKVFAELFDSAALASK